VKQTRTYVFRILWGLTAFGVLIILALPVVLASRMYRAYLRADDPVAKRQDAIQAIQNLRNEVARHPGSAETHVQLARQVEYPNYTEAEQKYKQAIALNANYLEAHDGLARIYSDQKRFPEAVREAQMVVHLSPAAGSYASLGEAYLQPKQRTSALKAMLQATRLDPKSEEYAVRLAYFHYDAGQIGQARQLWHQVSLLHGGKGYYQEQAREWLKEADNTSIP
jgi:tetratricopeptide (TPR) repeat protein